MSLTSIDFLLLLVIAYNVLRGWQSGFILGLLDLVGWLGSLLAAFRFYEAVARWLGPTAALPESLARPVAFGLVALGAGIALSLLGRLLVERLPARTHTHEANRLLGLAPGLVNGLLAGAILSSLLLALPLPTEARTATQESRLANRFATFTARVESDLAPIFGDAISQTLNLMTIHPESDQVVELPYVVSDAMPVPELEAEMLQMLNAARAEAGLGPLEMDPELVAVARQHSQDMFARGYFAHTNPDGQNPFDRIRAGNIPYLVAGENLAHASTLSIAHNGLMNSPGHRANILRPEFGRVGIGILDGGARGLMITQNFRN